MNTQEIEKVLNELDDFIQGRDVDSETYYKVRNTVSKLKDMFEIQSRKKDEIVFEYEDDKAKCQIIQFGVDGKYYFTMYEKEDDYEMNSIEDGIEYTNDGVYSTFESCMEELKEAYECFLGNKMNIK